MLRKCIIFCFFFGIITLSSCDLPGTKADKRIEVQLELAAVSASEEEKVKAVFPIN